MGYDVFISYAYRNKAEADVICAGLEQAGIRCWYAPRDIAPGDSWAEAIVTGIEAAKIMVVVVTESSVQSRQVLNEIACAVSAGVTIIPFRLTSSELSKSMKYYFSSVHWLDAVNKPLKDSVADLKNRVQRLLDPAPASRSQEKADPSRSAKPDLSSAARPQGQTVHASKPALDLPDHVGIEIGERSFSWGYLASDGSLVSETVPLSDKLLETLPAAARTERITRDVLSYIQSRSSGGRLFSCVAAVPSLTYRDVAQVCRAAGPGGIRSAAAIKRVSAAALSLFDKVQNDEDDSFTMVIEYSGSSCGTAIVQIGFGVVEIMSAVQREFSPEVPFSFDLLRKDIYKALDTAGARKITNICVAGDLPGACFEQLKALFRVECIQAAPDSVLRGLALLAGIRSGRQRDLLLLDVTDFEICVGTEPLIVDATTYPVERSVVLPYRTARKDHCIDVYIRKNNMTLDMPLAFRLSAEKVLDANRAEQELEITGKIMHDGRLSFVLRNKKSNRETVFGWEEIQEKLIAPS